MRFFNNPLTCFRPPGSREWREMESGGERKEERKDWERGGNSLYPQPLAVFSCSVFFTPYPLSECPQNFPTRELS